MIAIIYILAISCTNSSEKSKEVENLLEKISILEKKNNILKDSISKNEKDYLNSIFLIGIPYNQSFKIGKKDSISMLFHPSFKKLPKYEIYRIEDKKEIKIGENNNSKFNLAFTPKSIEDNKLKLIVKMPNKGNEIVYKCEVTLDVEK